MPYLVEVWGAIGILSELKQDISFKEKFVFQGKINFIIL